MSSDKVWQDIQRQVCVELEGYGFECYPFKVGWYNDLVQKVFAFDMPYDTLALAILSAPSMFDKAFKPFLKNNTSPLIRDPIDECMQYHFLQVKEKLGENGKDMIIIHDYELHHSHRPKVLMQTVGHVAGAARFYQRCDVRNDPWPQDKKMFPVALHPKYGGWFAFRGVFIFPNITCPELQLQTLDDTLSNEEKIDLLEKFNGNWKDASFRNIGNPCEKYSDEQLEYFNTHPDARKSIIEKIKSQSSA